MAHFTLILGGARSGKSGHAQRLAREAAGGKRVVYIATAQASDSEMAARIARHQQDRPPEWTTIEEPMNVAGVLDGLGEVEAVIIDCLTLYLTNHLLRASCTREDDFPIGDAEIAAAEQAVRDLIDAAKRCPAPVFLVSNEVGLGIVPETPLGRLFRDVAGRANQWAAASADRAVFMVSGLPMVLK